MSEATKERFLYCLARTGSVRAATSIVGVNHSSLYRLKSREPDFKTAWDDAAEYGDGVYAIAGAWTRREREFTEALPRVGWDIEAAAQLAGIPVRLAAMINDRQKPERVTVKSTKHHHDPMTERRSSASPQPTSQKRLSADELEALAQKARTEGKSVTLRENGRPRQFNASELQWYAEQERLFEHENQLTSKMRQFVDRLKQGLTPEQAAAELNVTMEEVDAWQKENSYFLVQRTDLRLRIFASIFTKARTHCSSRGLRSGGPIVPAVDWSCLRAQPNIAEAGPTRTLNHWLSD